MLEMIEYAISNKRADEALHNALYRYSIRLYVCMLANQLCFFVLRVLPLSIF